MKVASASLSLRPRSLFYALPVVALALGLFAFVNARPADAAGVKASLGVSCGVKNGASTVGFTVKASSSNGLDDVIFTQDATEIPPTQTNLGGNSYEPGKVSIPLGVGTYNFVLTVTDDSANSKVITAKATISNGGSKCSVKTPA